MTTVLVVDDDTSVSDMLKAGLEGFGYKVGAARNEEEFWSFVNKSIPDIVLMDVGMPGMDGISLCRKVKLSATAKDVPIIIITAFSDDQTYHDAMLFGASGFMPKPFEIPAVREKIEDTLAKINNNRVS